MDDIISENVGFILKNYKPNHCKYWYLNQPKLLIECVYVQNEKLVEYNLNFMQFKTLSFK